MTVTITIDCDNAAFSDDPGYELARILKDIGAKVKERDPRDWPTSASDYNGNKVAKIDTTL